MRLEGASYEEAARAGGGIVSTVAATFARLHRTTVCCKLSRVDAMIAEGVSTIEINKSGYGPDIENERPRCCASCGSRMSAKRLGSTSYLGKVTQPPEYKRDVLTLHDEVCIPGLDAAHAEGLVDAVDGFCEGIAFTPEQTQRVFDKALGIPVAARTAFQLWRCAIGRRLWRVVCRSSECLTLPDAANMVKKFRHRRGDPALRCILHTA
jgi:imidazolonepropionase